jgi:Fe-S-cluster-containing hydrogenase component 2
VKEEKGAAPQENVIHFRHVRKIEKSDDYLCHVCASVCPNGTIRLPLDEFSQNLIFEDFFFESAEKIPVSSSFRQGPGHMPQMHLSL